MLLNKYDKTIHSFDTVLNVLEWDRDFVSPKNSKQSMENEIRVIQLAKMEFIRRSFPKLSPTDSYAYLKFKKDYLYSYTLPARLEDSIIKTINDVYLEYKLSLNSGDIKVLAEKFAVMIGFLKEEIEAIPIKVLTNYNKLINYTAGSIFAESIDSFMSDIKCFAIGLIKAFGYTNRDTAEREYNVNTVEEMEKIMNEYGVDMDSLVLQCDSANSCLQLFPNDVRMTYSLPSTRNIILHEIGHVIYMQNIPKHFEYKSYIKPNCRVMDESIALLYELCINPASMFFSKRFLKTARRDITTNFLRALHVVIRYEIERDLYNGDLNPIDIFDVLNQKYSTYFNIQIDNQPALLLQDPHWFKGIFGYFPIYVISLIISLHIFFKYEMQKLSPKDVIDLLSEKVFALGSSVDIEQCLKNIGITDFQETTCKVLRKLGEVYYAKN